MWARARTAAFAAMLGACSILAPNDDELLGGSKGADASAGMGASAGSSGVGASAGSGGVSGGGGASGSGGAAGSGGASGSAGGGGVAGSSGAGGASTGGANTGGTNTGGTNTGGAPTGGTGGASSGGTGGGTGGNATVGCSDGTREAFKNVSQWPNVAGCDGGWTVPGVVSPASMQPTCARNSGNSSDNPSGTGCSVADLCAPGWEVCPGRQTFDSKSPTGCASDFNTSLYIIRQSMSLSLNNCSFPTTPNNIIGCGEDLGSTPGSGCSPLNAYMALNACNADPYWDCGNQSTNEAVNVVKSGPPHGGVICCRI